MPTTPGNPFKLGAPRSHLVRPKPIEHRLSVSPKESGAAPALSWAILPAGPVCVNSAVNCDQIDGSTFRCGVASRPHPLIQVLILRALPFSIFGAAA